MSLVLIGEQSFVLPGAIFLLCWGDVLFYIPKVLGVVANNGSASSKKGMTVVSEV
jgi:hypothetical protein